MNNANKSTGPITPEGKARSSQNSTKHGFTGQSLVLVPEEREHYAAHVEAYFDRYQPFDHETRQLTQQLADAHWSIHQIFVQQANLISLLNSATSELSQTATAVETLAAIAPLAKSLQTYTLYEQRRRRAAAVIQQQLETLLSERVEQAEKELPLAAEALKSHKEKGQPFNPADYKFVCSLQEIEQYLEGRELAKTSPQPVDPEALRRMLAEAEAFCAQNPE
jgi:hypothetical protein